MEHYQSLSEDYLTEARELLNAGDLVQAAEKFWGASALAVKRIGAMRGLKLEQHGSLWGFVSRLSRETGDKALIRLFTVANGLHRNFYDAQMNKE
jgi:hypothetical protein